MLILAIAGVVIAGMISVMAINRKMKGHDLRYSAETDEYYDAPDKPKVALIISTVVLSIGGLLYFIFTQNMNDPMVIVNTETLVNVPIFAAEMVTAVLAFRTSKDATYQSGVRY